MTTINAGAVIKNKSYKNMDLSNQDFSLMILENCDFTGADLSGTNFQNCDIQNCNFTGTKMKDTTFNKCELTSNLFFNILDSTKFNECTLVECKFSHTLYRCKFNSSDIKTTSFAKAKIAKSDFTGSRIENVDFSQSLLQRVEGLEHTIFNETSDSGVNLEILYILSTNTVYLSTELECVSMPLSEFAGYIESWYTSVSSRGLDYVMKLERLEAIENYLQLISKKTI